MMQEHERSLREPSASHPNVMVPIEFGPPPEHRVIIGIVSPAPFTGLETANQFVQHLNRFDVAQDGAPEKTSSPSSSSDRPSSAQKVDTHDASSLPTTSSASRQVPIRSQHTRSSTSSDKPVRQNDKTVSYYKAVPSPRPPVQTTTVEIVRIPNPTHSKAPASHLDATEHPAHPSSHKPSPAPFVVQHHPQNPWHGMSPVRSIWRSCKT
jgi:hypothetical protein